VICMGLGEKTASRYGTACAALHIDRNRSYLHLCNEKRLFRSFRSFRSVLGFSTTLETPKKCPRGTERETVHVYPKDIWHGGTNYPRISRTGVLKRGDVGITVTPVLAVVCCCCQPPQSKGNSLLNWLWCFPSLLLAGAHCTNTQMYCVTIENFPASHSV